MHRDHEKSAGHLVARLGRFLACRSGAGSPCAGPGAGCRRGGYRPCPGEGCRACRPSGMREWMSFHSKEEGWQAYVVNLTDALAAVYLAGPRSRDVLSRLTDADLSNDAFRTCGFVGRPSPARAVPFPPPSSCPQINDLTPSAFRERPCLRMSTFSRKDMVDCGQGRTSGKGSSSPASGAITGPILPPLSHPASAFGDVLPHRPKPVVTPSSNPTERVSGYESTNGSASFP
jgi:hypothetical protein